MLVIIQVEFLKEPGRSVERHGISRVPSTGEFLSVGEDCHEVHSVYHMLSTYDNECVAIVRVK